MSSGSIAITALGCFICSGDMDGLMDQAVGECMVSSSKRYITNALELVAGLVVAGA